MKLSTVNIVKSNISWSSGFVLLSVIYQLICNQSHWASSIVIHDFGC